MSASHASKKLAAFISRYEPEIAALAEDALGTMRALLPGAFELVYDNYNALAIGFSPSEKASEAIFSIALYPRWVSLFFLHGAGLPDPHRLLKGKGTRVRHIVLDDAATLDKPAVRALMAHALKRAPTQIDAAGPGGIFIKCVAEKQRPRRPRSS
jgi:hypothetical protein